MNDKTQSALTFPCDFPIKALGHSSAEFHTLVLEIVRRHAPGIGTSAVKARPSKGGKYTAITVIIRATSQDQLDAIYRELSSREEVLMAL
ncbi:MAG: DUF493 domain-containing protein [Pseudomonadota bacterium]